MEAEGNISAKDFLLQAKKCETEIHNILAKKARIESLREKATTTWGVEPEEVSVKYGSYVKLNGTETPADIEAGKAIMAEKAGEVVRDAMMGENLFIEGPGTLAWKVEIYARRITDEGIHSREDHRE